MANQPKQTRENKSVPWSSGLRPKVGDTVEYKNSFWTNLTGLNSEPFVGNDWALIDEKSLEPQIRTTNEITFIGPDQFGTLITPLTGNLTQSLTNAKLGLVQKIYHSDVVEPTYPITWKKAANGEYLANPASSNLINVIYVEWVSNTRQEYWIVQIEL